MAAPCWPARRKERSSSHSIRVARHSGPRRIAAERWLRSARSVSSERPSTATTGQQGQSASVNRASDDSQASMIEGRGPHSSRLGICKIAGRATAITPITDNYVSVVLRCALRLDADRTGAVSPRLDLSTRKQGSETALTSGLVRLQNSLDCLHQVRDSIGL